MSGVVNPRRILVTGANGQLGCSLRLAAAGSGGFWVFSDICEASGESTSRLRALGGEAVDVSTLRLDICDAEAVRKLLNDLAIDTIVNCAAYTAVDAAESHPGEAFHLNVLGPRVLASAAKERGALLLHISTDYVFGSDAGAAPSEGERRPLREEDPPSPLGVYGKTKLEGEEAILKSGCNCLILRTAWLYSEFGKNFCRTMLSLTASRPEVRVVNDQFGTPTYSGDLAAAIVRILTCKDLSNRLGIYHFTNEGRASWYDFATAIAADAGRRGCTVSPCTTADYPTAARRPAWSLLDKSKITAAFGLSIPLWRTSLRRCLRNLGERSGDTE